MKAGNLPIQDGEEEQVYERPIKKSNNLPIWGNDKTMNLNPLILTNIQSSQYFKVNLYQLKTYHEVIDEIYYQVNHLEPWEKGSRKTSGQTGMCGGVRGVGAGGIVSTAFCILYKLYTLKLTRKQLTGLINHADSPYIRGLGFMYIRFTQPPADLWEWFEGYLDDDETLLSGGSVVEQSSTLMTEIDVRAGGGQTTTIGTVVRHMLCKLDWHATLFPRIPVPIQKDIEKKLAERAAATQTSPSRYSGAQEREQDNYKDDYNGEARKSGERTQYDGGRNSIDRRDRDRSNREPARYNRESERDRERHRHRDRSRERDLYRENRDRHHHSSRHHHSDYSSELQREKERIRRDRRRTRSRSRSRDKHRRRRDY